MANLQPAADLQQFPPELIASVTSQAESDAGRVAVFLSCLGIKPVAIEGGFVPIKVPAGVLLALGAGLRLLNWESHGVTAHRDAGLPKALDALSAALRSIGDAGYNEAVSRLPLQVVELSIRRFAWCGPTDMQAEVELGDIDDDDLAEALADFLWRNRHAPAVSKGASSETYT